VDPDVVRGLFVLTANERATIQSPLAPNGLTLQAIQPDTSPEQVGAQFVADYRALSGGVTPTTLAASAYAAAQNSLRAIEQQIRERGRPAR
ncbi:MAG: hypothetical protein LC737_01995, partial [Chloroflexi bacterium]|nr:hypothetical protein [Chloroflexota bacterium]